MLVSSQLSSFANAGEDIMFNYRGCFCYNSSECWSENSTMYALTNNVGPQFSMHHPSPKVYAIVKVLCTHVRSLHL
jgi:hypothetical protein